MTGNGKITARASGNFWAYHGPVVLAVALAVLAAYLIPLSHGRAYFSHDTSDLNYVMLRSHVEDLRAHGFIAWLPALGTGHYRAANPTYGIYSPRIALFFLFRGYDAQLASIILYALWAGLGGYALGWVLTRSRAAAAYLGLVWPIGGVMASQVMNIPYFTSGAWLPWALAAWMGLGRAPLRIALTALCAAMAAMEGDLPGCGMMLGVLGLLAVLAPSTEGRGRDALCWAAAAAGALALTAVAWMPAWAMLPESRRAAGLTVTEAAAFSLHPLRLVNLLAPGLWGRINDGSFWAPWLSSAVAGKNLWFHSVYPGIFAPLFLLAALAIKHPGRRRAALLTAVAAMFTVLALGRHAGVMPWLMDLVPALRALRYPAKLFTFAALLLAAVSAMGLGRVEGIMADQKTRRRAAWAAALILLAALTALTRYAAGSAEAVRAASPNPGQSFLLIEQDLARIIAAIALLFAISYAAGRKMFPAAWAAPLLAALTALDLMSALPAYSFAKRDALAKAPALVREIRGLGAGRLVTSDNLYYFVKTSHRDALLPDWGVLDHVEYAFGKTASLPSRVSDLFERGRLEKNGAEIFRVLAVKYVMGTADPPEQWIAALAGAGVIRELAQDPQKNLALYEPRAANPAVFLARSARTAPDRDQALALALSGGSAEAEPRPALALDAAILSGSLIKPAPAPPATDAAGGVIGRVIGVDRPDGDHERIVAETSGPAWLVAREYLMPGWSARVDGREAAIYFADGIGRAVFLTPGRHVVEFMFQPKELRRGAWISFFAALAMIALLASWLVSEYIRNHSHSSKPQ